MRHYDLSPLYRTAIGFDRLASLLNDVQRNESDNSYPPYNIELVDENQYRIVMAVAGFDQSELDIETEACSLKVVGRKADGDAETQYLHRGIAKRNFEHKFQLADHVKVTDAKLENGLLEIQLVQEIPEALKPRKVAIGTGEAQQLLSEKAAA